MLCFHLPCYVRDEFRGYVSAINAEVIRFDIAVIFSNQVSGLSKLLILLSLISIQLLGYYCFMMFIALSIFGIVH